LLGPLLEPLWWGAFTGVVCVCRQVIVMDEATASVDGQTDELIQATVRRRLANGQCSLLVIAHRLHTGTSQMRQSPLCVVFLPSIECIPFASLPIVHRVPLGQVRYGEGGSEG
jgi:hypothetical protein